MSFAHPSSKLREVFSRKPYQGVHPAKATFLFVGLDANYAPDLESSPIFQRIIDYHEDGVTFWKRTGFHHPFLLPEYRGQGRRYHKAFARIGFKPDHAELVSFVELLHIPTTGVRPLEQRDLDPDHLTFVNDAILHGNAKHIFIPSKVLQHMRRSKLFGWVAEPQESSELLPVLGRSGERTVYLNLHFSYQFGKHQQLLAEAKAIGSLLQGEA